MYRSSFWILETTENNVAALSVRLGNQTAHAATQTKIETSAQSEELS